MHRAEQHFIFFLSAPAGSDDEDVDNSGEHAGFLKLLKHTGETCRASGPFPNV